MVVVVWWCSDQVAVDSGDIVDRSVLDLGCGTGMLTAAAALMGAGAVTGVDADGDALRIARENLCRLEVEEGVELLQADVAQLAQQCRTTTTTAGERTGRRTGRPVTGLSVCFGGVVSMMVVRLWVLVVRHGGDEPAVRDQGRGPRRHALPAAGAQGQPASRRLAAGRTTVTGLTGPALCGCVSVSQLAPVVYSLHKTSTREVGEDHSHHSPPSSSSASTLSLCL